MVMKTINHINIPETTEENSSLKILSYRMLHRNVMAVAKTRIEGAWKCYIFPVPGLDHEEEVRLWKPEGSQTTEAVARALFPRYADIPYAS